MAVRIEAVAPGLHDTKDFRCGSDSQDNFLRRTAKRQHRDGYTRLYRLIRVSAATKASRSESRPARW